MAIIPRRLPLEQLERAHAIVDILTAKFASDILLLDLTGLTIIADLFIIATGESARQLEAMADDLVKETKETMLISPLSVEGTASSGWILLDYGAIVVHLFSEDQRERYRLEELWREARTVIRIA